jgi:hypothetical protein
VNKVHAYVSDCELSVTIFLPSRTNKIWRKPKHMKEIKLAECLLKSTDAAMSSASTPPSPNTQNFTFSLNEHGHVITQSYFLHNDMLIVYSPAE